MRHRIRKNTFQSGIDGNSMLMRKLMKNFFRDSRITTTLSKAKVLKVNIERVITKTKVFSESNKNYLLRYFPEKTYQSVLFKQIGSALVKINGGYVRVVRLNNRNNDGAISARVEWAHPVVIDWKNDVAQKKIKKLEEKTPKINKEATNKEVAVKKGPNKSSSSKAKKTTAVTKAK